MSALFEGGIEPSLTAPYFSDLLADSYDRQPAIGSALVLDFARLTDNSPLAAQDFDLAEPMPLDGGDGVLIAGDGCDIAIGEPGRDLLIGGFAG